MPQVRWYGQTLMRWWLPVSDEDVMRNLLRLWLLSGWRRLEIGLGDDELIGGYCITGDLREVRSREAIRAGIHLDVLPGLHGLLRASGWKRLEILGEPGSGSANGWCERADGSGVHVVDCLSGRA